MKKALLYTVLFVILASGAYFYIHNKNATQGSRLYFFNDGKTAYVTRNIPASRTQLKEIAEQLLKGPTDEEKAKGFFTQIPRGTKLRSISKKGSMVTIDLSKEIGNYGGGTAKVEGLLTQIVYTLTEPGLKADRVLIIVNGKREKSLGSEGYIIEKPLTRSDLKL